ncbi:unnamed protein product, partial [Mesorhabditis spiculigera]
MLKNALFVACFLWLASNYVQGKWYDYDFTRALNITEVDVRLLGSSSDVALTFRLSSYDEGHNISELSPGQRIKYLIGFQNRGNIELRVKWSDVSFSPQDSETSAKWSTMFGCRRRMRSLLEIRGDRHFISDVVNGTIFVVGDNYGSSALTYLLYVVGIGMAATICFLVQHFVRKQSNSAQNSAPVYRESRPRVRQEYVPQAALRQGANKQSEKSPLRPFEEEFRMKRKEANKCLLLNLQ